MIKIVKLSICGTPVKLSKWTKLSAQGSFFYIFGHFRSQTGMFLVKVGTMSGCCWIPDTLNSLLVLYKIIEKVRQLSKVSDAVTHDEQLSVVGYFKIF